MGAKLTVLRLIMSFSPYLRSAMIRFPFEFGTKILREGDVFVIISKYLRLDFGLFFQSPFKVFFQQTLKALTSLAQSPGTLFPPFWTTKKLICICAFRQSIFVCIHISILSNNGHSDDDGNMDVHKYTLQKTQIQMNFLLVQNGGKRALGL